MSLEEKASLCSGKNFWYLEGSVKHDLPSVMVTDGPHGLRKQDSSADHVGLHQSVPATCFPTACALASSWDTELLHDIGVALGEQCVAENVAVLLGPGLNIKRHPLCGRNFEYFSEDPLLGGKLAAAMINGVQSLGVGTSLKHYAVNNQEDGRMFVNAIVDERTLREIYLRGFEIAVKASQPWTVMCAYNRLNGTYCSEHDWLLNKVLRDEWGFEGLVVTDWGATNDRVMGVSAGLDLEMPSSGGVNDNRVLHAVKTGELNEETLDQAIVRNVSLSLMGAEVQSRSVDLDQSAHHALARRAAAESTVLLKNEGGLLPLSPASNIAVIGAFAKEPRYQGAGSSQVTPTQLDCAFDAILEVVGEHAPSYAAGYETRHSALDESLIDEASGIAAQADVVIVFAGLPAIYESEGFDRPHMQLPEQHNQLIEKVCDANANTIVVLSNGAPVLMPWVSKPAAIVEGYLAGQAGGHGVVDVLFGKTNPSGKLAETFPLNQGDVPADQWFPGSGRQVQYREGLYVGYRYFDSADQPVLFPFGHGLSYTEFEYRNLVVSPAAPHAGEPVEISFDVQNTGEVAGAEVTQLYIRDVESSVYRPAHELKDFKKVWLEPGEVRRVTLVLNDDAFSVYDPVAATWVVEAGEFEIRIGASSRDIRLSTEVTVASDQAISASLQNTWGPEPTPGGCEVPDAVFASMLRGPIPEPESSKPYHLNSSIEEIAETWLGRRIKAKVLAGLEKVIGANGADETTQKLVQEMVKNMPLRSLGLFGDSGISPKALNVLVALMNGHYLQAIRLSMSLNSSAKW